MSPFPKAPERVGPSAIVSSKDDFYGHLPAVSPTVLPSPEVVLDTVLPKLPTKLLAEAKVVKFFNILPVVSPTVSPN